MKSWWIKILSCMAALLLVSCIDGHEEYWFHANGSGRAELTYSMPALAVRMGGGEAAIREKLEAFLKENPAFSKSTYQLTQQNGNLIVSVHVEFESLRDLKKLTKNTSGSSMSSAGRYFRGNIALAVQGLTLELTRTIEVGKAIPAARFLPQRELENHRLVYIVHLPTEVVETTATRTENSGKTLIWEVPLVEALKGPTVMHFKARIPLPTWLIVSAAGLVLAVIMVIFKIRRKKS